MDEAAFFEEEKKYKQPLFGINYMDWSELTSKKRKSAYYIKNEDDYADLQRDQKIHMFDK